MDYLQFETFTDVRGQPADVCFGKNLNFRGPTQFDNSMIPDHTKWTKMLKKENGTIKRWKNQDLAAYNRSLRSNYYK